VKPDRKADSGVLGWPLVSVLFYEPQSGFDVCYGPVADELTNPDSIEILTLTAPMPRSIAPETEELEGLAELAFPVTKEEKSKALSRVKEGTREESGREKDGREKGRTEGSPQKDGRHEEGCTGKGGPKKNGRRQETARKEISFYANVLVHPQSLLHPKGRGQNKSLKTHRKAGPISRFLRDMFFSDVFLHKLMYFQSVNGCNQLSLQQRLRKNPEKVTNGRI
jgi:hypothetical protein